MSFVREFYCRLPQGATAGPRQRGVSPGGGGGGEGAAPQQIAEGRGGFEGSDFSLQITLSQHAWLVLSMCMSSACVPWLLGWF